LRAIFVTATGTEIGKTYVTAALARYFFEAGKQARVLKPVLTGFDPDDFSATDPAILLDAAGVDPTIEEIERVSPFRYKAPLAPNLAAAREGKHLDFDAVVTACRGAAQGDGDVLLIEGIGGLMVPLDEKRTVLDLIEALRIPLLLVTGSYLGAISHTLTAVEVARTRKLEIRAIVVNETEDSSVSMDDTATTIAQFTSLAAVALPRGGAGSPVIAKLAGLL
jgi:dethiobiotin synthetase